MALSNLFGWIIKKKLLRPAERRAAPGTDRRNHPRPAERRAAPGTNRRNHLRPAEQRAAPETDRRNHLRPAERRAAPGTNRRNHLRPAEQRAVPGIVRTAREIISGGQTCPPEIHAEQSGSADFSPQQSSGGFFIRICERF